MAHDLDYWRAKVREIMHKREPDKVLDDDTVEWTAELMQSVEDKFVRSAKGGRLDEGVEALFLEATKKAKRE